VNDQLLPFSAAIKRMGFNLLTFGLKAIAMSRSLFDILNTIVNMYDEHGWLIANG